MVSFEGREDSELIPFSAYRKNHLGPFSTFGSGRLSNKY